MVIAITKRTKSSENKIEKLGEGTFTIPVDEVHLEISIYELWRKKCGITDFGKRVLLHRGGISSRSNTNNNNKNGDQKAGSFESNTAKFRQSRHGSFEWNIFLRYLSTLSDIWHFTICKIRRENCCDMLPIRSENFSSSQCKQSPPQTYVKRFSHWANYFKMAAVGLDIWGPWSEHCIRSCVLPLVYKGGPRGPMILIAFLTTLAMGSFTEAQTID